MFAREQASLPADPVFPPTLEENGFSINGDNQIRRLDKPELGYRFKVSPNQRYNCLYEQNMKGRLQHTLKTLIDIFRHRNG
jgi:hypothetical protein